MSKRINLDEYLNNFLPHKISDKFSDLDGKDIATWLTNQKYKVISNEDTGRCGVARTQEGYSVCTNGYVYIANKQNTL